MVQPVICGSIGTTFMASLPRKNGWDIRFSDFQLRMKPIMFQDL